MRPLIKTHGGKNYLKHWVISNFPKDYEKMFYLEPFIGGGSILLNKKPSPVEIINDLDSMTANLWEIVRNPLTFTQFHKKISCIDYLSMNFDWAKHSEKHNLSNSPFDWAVIEYILRKMSRGGMKKNFAKSNRLRGGIMGDKNAWLSGIKELPLVASRIKNVIVKNKTAIEVIQQHSCPNSLIYCDPPYLASTRVSKQVYSHEMTYEDHEELLDTLLACKGKVIISGYDSVLYFKKIGSWNKSVKQIVNHSSQSKTKKTKEEIIWKNF